MSRTFFQFFFLILCSISFGFASNASNLDQLNQEIKELEKKKEYYEVTIKRTQRTAWRLEFQDPGYSRQLNQKTRRYQQKLDEVNAELAQKYKQRSSLTR